MNLNIDDDEQRLNDNLDLLLSQAVEAEAAQQPNTNIPEPWYTRTALYVVLVLMFLLCVATLAASVFVNRQVITTQEVQTGYAARQALNEASIKALQEANEKLAEQGKPQIAIPDTNDPGSIDATQLSNAAASLVLKELPSVQNGEQGIPGVVGPVGPSGPQGEPGEDGEQGPEGAPGTPGPIGPSGIPGIPGINGIDGLNGVSITNLYISNCSLYFTLSNGVTTDVGNVCGPQGIQGNQGDQGPQGPTGAAGVQGPPGDTGPQGDPGPQGEQGPQGPTGAQGDPGPPGDSVTVTETVTEILPTP